MTNYLKSTFMLQKNVFILLLLSSSQFSPIFTSDQQQNVIKDNNLLPETSIPLHSFSLHPPYVEENLNNRWWNFGGDAYVEIMNYVRLAANKQSKQGWLFSRVPLTSLSWLIEIVFKVHGHTAALYGDGFAFWFTTERESPGPVFGNKDHWNGLGVFFDTYSNGQHHHSFPYVYGILNDASKTYHHENDGFDQQIGGCTADFRNKEYLTKARIKYAKGKYLQVELNFRGFDAWEVCFMAENITLPTSGYIGFTAWTGDVSDNHDIIRVSSYSLMNPESRLPLTPLSAPKVFSTGLSSGSFMMHAYNFIFWLAIILFILALVIGVYFAFGGSGRGRGRQAKRF